MTLDEKGRKDLIEYRVGCADDSINDIELLLKNNRLKASVNRIYYGYFYIISALALKERFSTKSHHQLIGWFNKNYVKEKLIDTRYGQGLVKSFEIRSKGDYGDFVIFEKEEVEKMFIDLKEFIVEVKKLIFKDIKT